MIAEAIRGADWRRSATCAPYEQRAVPRDVYAGLSTSARLADFDPQMRGLLYSLYWRASLGDHVYMNGSIREAIERVAQFTAENAPGAEAAWSRLKRRLKGREDAGGGAPMGGVDVASTVAAPAAKAGVGSAEGRQSSIGAPMGGGA